MPKPLKAVGGGFPIDPQKSDPSLIARKIQENSLVVNELASALSQRISDFEDWLRNLPGKVSASVWIDDPNDERYVFGIRFARYGQWRLSFGCQQRDKEVLDEDNLDWNPLTDASLEIKMAAVAMFPGLLESIAAVQDQRTQELKTVNRDFEAFAHLIALPMAKEGASDVPF